MADAGSIAITRSVGTAMPLSVWAAGNRTVSRVSRPIASRMRLATYAADATTVHRLPRPGYIAGTVQTGGSPSPDRLVLLIYRSIPRVIASTRTADDGSFRFDELLDGPNYLTIALEATQSPPSQNAAVADYLTPAAA